MQYVNLGKCGLKVSVISFGNMVNNKQQKRQQDTKIIKKCLQAGINFFDTAEIYAEGQSEIALGQIFKTLKVQRESIIVATKVWTSKNPDINSTSSVNRKHLNQALNASLSRLQLQYVDILFAHGYDSSTPLQQVCRGFHQLIESGLCFYWGTSNWSALQVFNAFNICQKYNLHKPICAQNQYNMLVRKEIQVDYEKLFKEYKYGLVAWSPLAGGYLTGKHLDGVSKEEGNRLTGERAELYKQFFFDPHNTEKNNKALKDLTKYAEQQLKCTLTHLALAWCIKFKYTSTSLIGARTVTQLQDSLKSLQIVPKLTAEVQAKINKILGTSPDAPINFLQWKPYQTIRPVAKQ